MRNRIQRFVRKGDLRIKKSHFDLDLTTKLVKREKVKKLSRKLYKLKTLDEAKDLPNHFLVSGELSKSIKLVKLRYIYRISYPFETMILYRSPEPSEVRVCQHRNGLAWNFCSIPKLCKSIFANSSCLAFISLELYAVVKPGSSHKLIVKVC